MKQILVLDKKKHRSLSRIPFMVLNLQMYRCDKEIVITIL